MLRARGLIRLRTLVVIADAQGTLTLAEPVRPGPIELKVTSRGLSDMIPVRASQTNLRGRDAVVGQEKPEAEDWLGQDVQDGIGDDLSVDRHVAGSISDGPDASERSGDERAPGREDQDSHRVGRPDDDGVEGNGREEGGGLGVASLDVTSSRHGQEVDDGEVCQATDGIVS